MFMYKGTRELLIEVMRENEDLKAQSIKNKADMEYMAMMSDIDLEEGEEDEQEI